MTGLVRVTCLPIPAVRTTIEVTVAGAGWLGGTVLIALCMGPLVGLFPPRATVPLPPAALRDRIEP